MEAIPEAVLEGVKWVMIIFAIGYQLRSVIKFLTSDDTHQGLIEKIIAKVGKK